MKQATKYAKYSRVVPLAALAALLLAAGCDDGANPVTTTAPEADFSAVAAPQASNAAEPLRVMTRNMYLGGNIAIVLAADYTNPMALVEATNTVWSQVQNTRFQERVVALVDEIQAGNPHIVGIQELAKYVILDGSFQPIGAQDHGALLMAEIQRRGLPYEMAALHNNFEITMPRAVDWGSGQVTEYIHFVLGVAVLVRSDVTVLDVDQANYQAAVPLPFGGEIRRGWIRVETELGGLPYHFVNTHLEVQDFAPFQVAQTQELISGVLAGLEGMTVLMGDLNSDAEAGPGDRSWTPTYDLLLEAGFQDAWRTANPGRPFRGYTCCHADELRNPTSELDQRIDFVLVRASGGPAGGRRLPGKVSADVIGDETSDLTASGLWPSDHAGLLATFRTPEVPFLR